MNFFDQYLAYTKDTESPRIYHRWCALTAVGALLGRKVYLRHGHANLFPTLYVMFVGEAGSRKSTAIKLGRKLLSTAGYKTFAADKSSKEKFLVDLATDNSDDPLVNGNAGEKNGRSSARYDDITADNLWGVSSGGGDKRLPKEVFISADEFNDFAGPGNHELYTTLGNLWDWDDPNRGFTQRFKSGSIDIFQPTVSLLGGNTQENFARAFPPETLGTGFLSRMLLIHGKKTDILIADPEVPEDSVTAGIVKYMQAMRDFTQGKSKEVVKSPEAKEMLAEIYVTWLRAGGIKDVRFTTYNARRHTQLQKLCVLLAGASLQLVIDTDIVLHANTVLSAAEQLMPEALGEFGKGKHSDISNTVMRILEEASRPVEIGELWKHVIKDLNGVKDLGEILNSLEHAGKIQLVKGKGWLPRKEVKGKQLFVDWSLLTEEERRDV